MSDYNDTYSDYMNTGTSSDDSLNMSSSGTVRGLGGNDTINIKSSRVYANGGSGADLFIVDSYSSGNLTDITITAGDGKDTIQFRPDTGNYYTFSGNLEILITDFSSKDVIRFDGSDYIYSSESSNDYYRGLTHEVEDGNIVIRDNASINTSSGESDSITPKFSVTLQGISDIKQVANAKFYRYFDNELKESKTLGEIFVSPEEDSDTILTGSDSDVTLIGSDSDVTLTVSDSDVTLTGSDSDTILTGSDSDTTLTGSDSDTTLTGSDSYTTLTGPVTISGSIGSTVPTVITYGSSTATVAATVTTAGGDGDTVLVVDSSFIGGGGGDTIINTGPVIVDSSIEGGVGNTYYVTVNVGTLEITNNYYTYEGGYRFLQDYTEGQVIQLDTDYRGIDLFKSNFIVKSSTGQLEIQNACDKFISYSGPDGRVTAYSYVSSDEGNISGKSAWSSQIDILIGAENKNNKITGGYGSSSLWGGSGQNGNDTLIGGYGYNEFFYAIGNGNDVIKDADSGDLVNLASVRLSQITSAEVTWDAVNIRFDDGGSLYVKGDTSGLAYQVAEGTFTCNQDNGKWTQK